MTENCFCRRRCFERQARHLPHAWPPASFLLARQDRGADCQLKNARPSNRGAGGHGRLRAQKPAAARAGRCRNSASQSSIRVRCAPSPRPAAGSPRPTSWTLQNRSPPSRPPCGSNRIPLPAQEDDGPSRPSSSGGGTLSPCAEGDSPARDHQGGQPAPRPRAPYCLASRQGRQDRPGKSTTELTSPIWRAKDELLAIEYRASGDVPLAHLAGQLARAPRLAHAARSRPGRRCRPVPVKFR